MATFSVNQVRHLYVAKELKEGANLKPTDAAGSILPRVNKEKTTLYFKYMSPGGMTSSDKITLSNVMYTKATKSSDQAKKLDRYELKFSPSINGGNPIVGQDYLLRLAFRQYIGLSEEDQYWKYGTAHAVVNMTPSDLYKTLAHSLVKNLSREVTPLVKVFLMAAGAATEVVFTTKLSELTGTYDAIQIEQVEQDWVLGTMPLAFIPFTVQPTTVTFEGDEVIWGEVEQVDSVTTVENGKVIADMEYFYMGSRGDIYRNIGWPNVIPTKYLIDPTLKYDTLDIHYYTTLSNESVQKSEKTITLVAIDDGTHKDMNALIEKINSLSGLTIEPLA